MYLSGVFYFIKGALFMSDTSSDLSTMRHSFAHIMANAIQRKWPDAKFGVGPAIDNGFYYDVDLGDQTITEEDFSAIEEEMKAIIKSDEPFVRSEKSIDDAIAWAEGNGQNYKLELLNDLKREGTTSAKDLDEETLGTVSELESKVDTVSFYTNGDFTDLCRGPHVASTGKVGAFKLNKMSGVYWRGNEKNRQMQRVYGLAFENQQELATHLVAYAEAQKRDHRKLGKELDLFVFSDLVGSGLPMFTPRGTVLREELANFSNELRIRHGFQKVWIPHITKKDLYEKSGHWAKFGDELFLVESQESSDQFAMKPMNCPHHTQIYASNSRSYKEMPIRYLETTTIYRDEKKGELNGLSRVRSATQDDSHVFCRQDQIEQEINNLLESATDLYKAVDLKLKARLSYRDNTDAYLGEPELWQSAQEQLKNAVINNKIDYFEQNGEAAFYGPKIDFMATDALGREHQLATLQLDFVMPERFGLEYVTEDGSQARPVMIHCALLGSIERFISVYIEHTAGKFPVWLAPEQIRIITVNQEQATLDYAESISSKAREKGLRLYLDNSNESVGKKIRSAEIAKVPYTIVIGEKEIQSSEVVPRIRSDMAVMDVSISIGVNEFLQTIVNEAKSRVTKTSL
jgi:threonyl-tRNA synthetase